MWPPTSQICFSYPLQLQPQLIQPHELQMYLTMQSRTGLGIMLIMESTVPLVMGVINNHHHNRYYIVILFLSYHLLCFSRSEGLHWVVFAVMFDGEMIMTLKVDFVFTCELWQVESVVYSHGVWYAKRTYCGLLLDIIFFPLSFVCLSNLG